MAENKRGHDAVLYIAGDFARLITGQGGLSPRQRCSCCGAAMQEAPGTRFWAKGRTGTRIT
ncbi:hypothetical protein JL2886_03313 [Phaeobacter gallaeciensis]|uniref:Uncharacterized protein n=1 Tax=Phaeobacter gallaeciensis TaxID=60890 RepID=A0A1B0ZVL3_9RHOB|nr:hypothetical protein JL2886_03313 [Phaeobacter gallaeciensis]